VPKSSEIDKLLCKLCVDLGFCLPPDECDKLGSKPPSTPDAFTKAVFLAEGLDWNLASDNLFKKVRGYVAEAFRHSATLRYTISED
jgi:hypothetical protein